MIRKNECPQISEAKNQGDSWARGRKLVQDLGLLFKEIKTFQGGSALQGVTHHSSVHCLNTMGFALSQDAARIFHETALSLFHRKQVF